MPTFYKAPTANYVSTTLNGSIDDSTTTITLNSVSNLQAPGIIVIDREDGNNTATPNAREVVSFAGISGSDLTGCVRAFDNSTARSHSDGALVETMPTVGLWNDLRDAVAASMLTDGSGVHVGTATITSLLTSPNVLASAATIAGLMNVRAALVSTMTINLALNASGASIVGTFPAGFLGTSLKVRAYLNGDMTNLTDNTYAKVTLNAETYDPGADFDAVTENEYIVPEDGLYLVIGQVTFTGLTANKTYSAAIFVDDAGVSQADVHNGDSTAAVSARVFDFLDLNASQVVDLRARPNSIGGNTVDINGSSLTTYLVIVKVGSPV